MYENHEYNGCPVTKNVMRINVIYENQLNHKMKDRIIPASNHSRPQNISDIMFIPDNNSMRFILHLTQILENDCMKGLRTWWILLFCREKEQLWSMRNNISSLLLIITKFHELTLLDVLIFHGAESGIGPINCHHQT